MLTRNATGFVLAVSKMNLLATVKSEMMSNVPFGFEDDSGALPPPTFVGFLPSPPLAFMSLQVPLRSPETAPMSVQLRVHLQSKLGSGLMSGELHDP